MNRPRPLPALLLALLCHSAFVLAVGWMALSFATGMQLGRGTLHGPLAALANALLVLQFPLVHSFLLSRRGSPVLQRLSPVGHGRTLSIGSFALIGPLQLLLTFWAWSPSGVVWHRPAGVSGGLQWLAFALAWLFLQKGLWDAGLTVQSGAGGWWALLRGEPVDFGPMPTGRLFRRGRQPIYSGFAAVMWTAPTWTPDWLLLTAFWSTCCVVGPRLQEARWRRLFGERFVAYRATVPYLLPRIRR